MYNIKLLLVSANTYKVPYPVYPLGLSYIATYLRSKLPGIDIRFFDFNMNTHDDYVHVLKKFKPEFTGISLRNVDDVNALSKEYFYWHYRHIIETTRENSDSIIVLGGAAYSVFPEVLFERLNPDYGIAGEGEESLRLLIMHLVGIDEKPLEEIGGLVHSNGSVTKTNNRNSMSKFLDLDFEDSLVDYYWQKSGMLNVQTKRGCPFDCIYCTYPLIEGRNIRTLDADKIVESLAKLKKDRGIDYVFFTDSVFNIKNSFNVELSEKLIKSGLKIRWGAYFTLTNLNEDMLSLYKRAGLEHIEFGTESFSESQLHKYGKHFGVSEVLKMSEICNKLGIYFAHFLILCGWGETIDTLKETFNNSLKIKNSVFFPNIGMRIYPGTPLYNKSIEEGVIDKNDDLIIPKYYIKPDMDFSDIKAMPTGNYGRWVFPDEDNSRTIERMRIKGKKGPLWEYIIASR